MQLSAPLDKSAYMIWLYQTYCLLLLKSLHLLQIKAMKAIKTSKSNSESRRNTKTLVMVPMYRLSHSVSWSINSSSVSWMSSSDFVYFPCKACWKMENPWVTAGDAKFSIIPFDIAKPAQPGMQKYTGQIRPLKVFSPLQNKKYENSWLTMHTIVTE